MNALPGSCSEMCKSPCNDAYEATSIQAKQGTDIEIKVEEIPESISFPAIKAEPDEVSLCVTNIQKWLGCFVVFVYWSAPVWGMEISASSLVM